MELWFICQSCFIFVWGGENASLVGPHLFLSVMVMRPMSRLPQVWSTQFLSQRWDTKKLNSFYPSITKLVCLPQTQTTIHTTQLTLRLSHSYLGAFYYLYCLLSQERRQSWFWFCALVGLPKPHQSLQLVVVLKHLCWFPILAMQKLSVMLTFSPLNNYVIGWHI